MPLDDVRDTFRPAQPARHEAKRARAVMVDHQPRQRAALACNGILRRQMRISRRRRWQDGNFRFNGVFSALDCDYLADGKFFRGGVHFAPSQR